MPPKVNKKGPQNENPVNPENPSQVPEGEPRVDLGDQEMDVETMRILIATMQVEMTNLKSSHDAISQTVTLQHREMERQRREMADQQAEVLRRQTEAAVAMETALRLARGAPEAPPQQRAPPNSVASTVREERTRARTPNQRPASRAEIPPARSARREEPAARPAESARREEHSEREERPARSPQAQHPR